MKLSFSFTHSLISLSLPLIVQAGGGGAHRHRGLGRADRGERLHEHRAHPPLGQRLQGRSGEE